MPPRDRVDHSVRGLPMKGESVFDEDRQEYGVVSRRLIGSGGSIMVRFGSEPEILYTLRAALHVWKAFPGSPAAKGLRSLEE